MNDLEKTIYFNNLLSLYSCLLTDTQSDILIEYYQANLSISEIAENRNVSRAAIEDAIRKGSKKLLSFEERLHLYEKRVNKRNIIAKLRENSDNSVVLELLKELEDID